MSGELNGVEKSMDYYLTKRKKTTRSYFYVNFTDPEDPRKVRLSTSVELLRRKYGDRSKMPVTREKEAYFIVERAISEGLINLDREIIFFADFVKEFWDFDNSLYIRRRNQKSPNSIGKDYANLMFGNFVRHAIPHLPENLKINEVTAIHIENVVDQLLDANTLSNATIQKVVQSMSVPLKEATRKKMIAHNPMDGVEPLSNTPKERGIYTIEELLKVMEYLYKKGTVGVTEMRPVRGPDKTVVEKPYEVKTDLKPYLAVALASYTGMRAGEIRALSTDQIQIIDDKYGIINVDRAYNYYAGLKSTKGKRSRRVPLPRHLCDALLKEASINPYEGSTLVFWNKKSEINPISPNYILNQFYIALEAIGVTEQQRKERNVDFHSLRHTFNSFLRGKVNEKMLRSIVGHESITMTDRYTHETDNELIEVGRTVLSIFSDEDLR
ncbi:MAG: site-specific integrase [Sphaerochaetaceae bacterium]|jgi:integrase|nr:site-specific integrase [Sphaerochaetaceae bacterium]